MVGKGGVRYAAAALLCALPPLHAAAQDATAAPAPPPAIAEDARAILERAADFAASLDKFAFDYRVLFALTGANVEQRSDALFRYAVDRPNRAAVTGVQGLKDYAVVADGERLYIHMPDVKAYTLEPPIAQLSDFPGLMHLSAQIPLGGLSDILLLDNFYDALMGGVQSLAYLGDEDVKGEACHRLRFVEEAFDWDMWIAAGEKPFIRRIVPDPAKQLAQVNAQIEGHAVAMEVLIEFDNWAVGAGVPDGAFAIAPPPDSRQVEDFAEAAAEDGAAEAQP